MEQTERTPAQLITRQEAKTILKVSARTVDRLVERGLLQAIRMPSGRAVRFRLTTIEEFVNRCEDNANVG